MGAIKLVVLAEGAAETGGAPHTDIPPGALLTEDMLGVAHILARRLAAPLPEEAVQFLRPLKLRGRTAKGSDLISKITLHQLLTWPQLSRPHPDATLIIVDEDGDAGRAKLLDGITLRIPAVLALARPEFESWLLADHDALQRAVGATFDMCAAPDELARGKAKEHLADCVGRHTDQRTPAQVRRDIARALSVEAAAKRSPSFARFSLEARALFSRLRGA